MHRIHFISTWSFTQSNYVILLGLHDKIIVKLQRLRIKTIVWFFLSKRLWQGKRLLLDQLTLLLLLALLPFLFEDADGVKIQKNLLISLVFCSAIHRERTERLDGLVCVVRRRGVKMIVAVCGWLCCAVKCVTFWCDKSFHVGCERKRDERSDLIFSIFFKKVESLKSGWMEKVSSLTYLVIASNYAHKLLQGTFKIPRVVCDGGGGWNSWIFLHHYCIHFFLA